MTKSNVMIENAILLDDTALYKSTILAGLSDKLYHKTPGENALSILTKNTFHLVQSETNASEIEHRRKPLSYFMSTARSLTSSFLWRTGVRSSTVVFNLNGVKLRQKFSGGPVNYWGDRNAESGWDKGSSGTAEAEDRIESSQPYIRDADKYIDSVHVFVMTESKMTELIRSLDALNSESTTGAEYWKILQSGVMVLGDTVEEVRKIKVECLRKGIPVFFYFDVMKFKTQRGGSNLPLKYFDGILKGLPEKEKVEYGNPSSDLSHYSKKGMLLPWIMLMNLPIKGKMLGEDASSIQERKNMIRHHTTTNGVKNLTRVYDELGLYSKGRDPGLEGRLRNEMFQHSTAKYDHPMKERENLNLLISEMRKKGIKTLKGLLDYLSGKWFPEN